LKELTSEEKIIKKLSFVSDSANGSPAKKSKPSGDDAKTVAEVAKKSPSKVAKKSPGKVVKKSPGKVVPVAKKSPEKVANKSLEKVSKKTSGKMVKKSPAKMVKKSPAKMVKKSPGKAANGDTKKRPLTVEVDESPSKKLKPTPAPTEEKAVASPGKRGRPGKIVVKAGSKDVATKSPPKRSTRNATTVNK
jgi:hypothetical protein